MNQLNQTIQILCSHRVVLLVKEVDITVQDFDEQFNGHSGIHAGVGDTEGTLKALKDAFAVAIGLGIVSENLK